jgi:hypothetical protein
MKRRLLVSLGCASSLVVVPDLIAPNPLGA